MDNSRKSKDAVVESPSSSTEPGGRNQNSQRHRRLEESIADHLQKALDAETPEKNYYIRSALQAQVIIKEDIQTD